MWERWFLWHQNTWQSTSFTCIAIERAVMVMKPESSQSAKSIRSVRTESDFTLSPVLCAHLCYNHARRPSASPKCPQIHFEHITLLCTKNNLNIKNIWSNRAAASSTPKSVMPESQIKYGICNSELLSKQFSMRSEWGNRMTRNIYVVALIWCGVCGRRKK